MKVRLLICLILFAFAFTPHSVFAQCCPAGTGTPAPSTSGPSSFAFEFSPYAGYVWNANNNGVGSFMNNQILGVRGGGYVTNALEIGGNWSWNNHFQPKNDNTTASFAGDLGFPQAAVRSNLWEVEFTYHFGSRGVFGHAVRPYLVAGGGGITTNMKNGDEFVLNNTFIDVPGVSTTTLKAAQANGTLQAFVPGANLSNGVAIASFPPGAAVPTGSTVIVANDVLRDHVTFFTFSYGGGLKAQRLLGPLGFFGDVRGRTIPNFFNGHGTNLLELTAGLNFAFGER